MTRSVQWPFDITFERELAGGSLHLSRIILEHNFISKRVAPVALGTETLFLTRVVSLRNEEVLSFLDFFHWYSLVVSRTRVQKFKESFSLKFDIVAMLLFYLQLF